jgi:citrate lyase beta subunit
MRPTRSALFVPGNKPDWIDKALRSGADHLILDLEDSVPDTDTVKSRGPTHVPIVNEAFSPKPAEIAYYEGLLAAYEEGQRRGTAAVLYEGDMIDTAMAVTARETLALAREIGIADA